MIYGKIELPGFTSLQNTYHVGGISKIHLRLPVCKSQAGKAEEICDTIGSGEYKPLRLA